MSEVVPTHKSVEGKSRGPYLFSLADENLRLNMLGRAGILLLAKAGDGGFDVICVIDVTDVGKILREFAKLKNSPWEIAKRDHGANAMFVDSVPDQRARQDELKDLIDRHHPVMRQQV